MDGQENMAATEEKITVYGTTWCPDCTRSKRCLERNGIAYEWRDIEKNAADREYVVKVNRGKRSVPTIVFADGSVLVEPSDTELEKKLGLRPK
jgi:glutaredoxin-like protein